MNVCDILCTVCLGGEGGQRPRIFIKKNPADLKRAVTDKLDGLAVATIVLSVVAMGFGNEKSLIAGIEPCSVRARQGSRRSSGEPSPTRPLVGISNSTMVRISLTVQW